jgi:hypothetical protein
MNKSLFFRWAALAVVIALAAVAWRFGVVRSKELTPAITTTASITGPLPGAINTSTATTTNAAIAAAFSGRARPLPVTKQSVTHEWTVADAKSPAVIQQVAHSLLEYERMVQENDRIKRRQLVYRNETAALAVQRARLTGEPLQRLTLPGLDGQEVEFEITRTDLSPSGQQGGLSGHIAGRSDSLVTLAFKGGREAFTVVSPADNLYLVGEPREPGEVIVKSIDPDIYASGYCGNP